MALKRDNKIKGNLKKITISLASPEEILENSNGEVTIPTAPKETVCSANVSSDRYATTSVIAVNTSVSATKVSYATVAASKLPKRRFAANVRGISNLPFRWLIYGISIRCRIRLVTCSECLQKNSIP